MFVKITNTCNIKVAPAREFMSLAVLHTHVCDDPSTKIDRVTASDVEQRQVELDHVECHCLVAPDPGVRDYVTRSPSSSPIEVSDVRLG